MERRINFRTALFGCLIGGAIYATFAWHFAEATPKDAPVQEPPGDAPRALLFPEQLEYGMTVLVLADAEESQKIDFDDKARRAIERLQTAIVLPGEKGDVTTGEHIHRLHERLADIAARYGIDLKTTPAPLLAIIDEKNRLRHLESVEDLTPDAVLQFANTWSLGAAAYKTHCMRCHGADGTDDSYPSIVTLNGIGSRMNHDEILEATWASGLVAPEQLSKEEQYALGVYVASL